MSQLSLRFEEALSFATRLHASQVRKGTEIPYIAHLLAVSSLVLENAGTEDEAIAALLHDAIEDQGGAETREEITRRFGTNVCSLVVACSDSQGHPKPPWRLRKEAYIAHLQTASASVRLISCADKLHNARSLLADYRVYGEALWQRFGGGRAGTLWYYRAVTDALQARGTTPLVEELARVVNTLELLAQQNPPESQGELL